MRQQGEDNDLFNPFIRQGFRLNVGTIIPANGFVVDPNMPTFLDMTPAGAINVLMPPSTAARKGLVFIFTNFGAGGVITLQTDGGAAFATAVTVAINGGVTRVRCTGNPTANLGWLIW